MKGILAGALVFGAIASLIFWLSFWLNWGADHHETAASFIMAVGAPVAILVGVVVKFVPDSEDK